ncbi:uncharacterized protein LOC142357050 isoform X2 [Convolutriloba macropyga]|uniref:uncharacterized protein LOC142357050 isoform X2 n=1 Tax=Convolutriloba macropyga TaxID=536237 RepID=UPI003F52763F
MAGGQTQLGVTCVECPELRSLVGVLEEHIDPDQLVPGDECLEHDEAVLACRRERLRFLQKTALLSDIESILDDFSLSGSETSWDMHGSEGALMTCRPNVYSAMHKAFVGARASQQLFTPQLQNLSLEPSILVDSSTVNIFGLSPTDLQNNTQQQVPHHACCCLAAAVHISITCTRFMEIVCIHIQVHIIPELELRLACHQSWLSEALGDATGELEGPTQSLGLKVSSRISKLRMGRHALAEQSVENTVLFAECSAC